MNVFLCVRLSLWSRYKLFDDDVLQYMGLQNIAALLLDYSNINRNLNHAITNINSKHMSSGRLMPM